MAFTTDDYVSKRQKKDLEFEAEIARQDLIFPIAMEIIRLRDAAGLTQAELAHLIGTKQPAIARIENGETFPSVQTLSKIATALHQKLSISFLPEQKIQAH